MDSLLSLTELAVWVGFPAVFLCLVMIGYSLAFGRRTQQTDRPSRSWTLFVAFLVFLAAWLWLSPAIFLLAWAAWFGDNMPLWFRKLAPWLAAGVGLLLAARVIWRVRAGRGGGRYLGTHFIIAVILVGLMGTLRIHEWASKIYGSTPQAAAEKYLEKFRGLPDQYQLVEERRWSPVKTGKPRWVSYRIVDPHGVAQARIRVARYSRF